MAKEEGMGSDLEEEGEDEEGEEDRNMGGAASEGGGAKDAKKNTKSLSKYILKDMQVPALAKLIVEQINPQRVRGCSTGDGGDRGCPTTTTGIVGFT